MVTFAVTGLFLKKEDWLRHVLAYMITLGEDKIFLTNGAAGFIITATEKQQEYYNDNKKAPVITTATRKAHNFASFLIYVMHENLICNQITNTRLTGGITQ